jgi:glycosyltransferase involved in cell wall biosynthesis
MQATISICCSHKRPRFRDGIRPSGLIARTKMASAKISILHVGPHPRLNGGISSVTKGLLGEQSFFDDNNIKLHFLGTLPFTEGYRAIWSFAGTLAAFIGLNLTKRFDAVHLHVASKGSFYRKFIFFLIAKFFGKKVIFHLHGGGFFDFFDRGSWLTRHLIRFFEKHVTVIIVVSTDQRSKILERFPLSDKIKIIFNYSKDFENAIAPSFEKPKLTASYILFAGRLEKSKGVDEIFCALSMLRNKGLIIRLKLAGTGDLAFWRESATSYGIAEQVDFIGWADGERKLNLFRQASIFCLPSHFESFGIAALEAMLTKTPIVSTRLGGFLDLVEDGIDGCLVEKGDVNGLANCIERLWCDEALAHTMGGIAYKKAKSTFSAAASLNKLVHIYSSL